MIRASEIAGAKEALADTNLDVNHAALNRMFSPRWWFSRVGDRKQRQNFNRRRDTGPRGLAQGVPCDEASGDMEAG